jgi:NAD(P)H-dependent FMN reductase
MNILVLNGSPKKNGTVAQILKQVTASIDMKHNVEWIDIYDLTMKPCVACLKCRKTGTCAFPEDDAHRTGEKIKNAGGIVIGTPTYWGNMSSQLKVLFERIVPVIMKERDKGFPMKLQKGKPALIVTACTTPWPLNWIFPESRGAVQSVREILNYGGYKIKGSIVKSGSKKNPELSKRILRKTKRANQWFR